MNYHQTRFNPGRKQTPEEFERERQERIKRMTDLLEQAALEKNEQAVKEYKFLLGRL